MPAVDDQPNDTLHSTLCETNPSNTKNIEEIDVVVENAENQDKAIYSTSPIALLLGKNTLDIEEIELLEQTDEKNTVQNYYEQAGEFYGLYDGENVEIQQSLSK
jgi:hypothetical protein